MPKDSSIQVLGAYWPLHRFITAYHPSQFKGKPWHTLKRNILLAIGVTIFELAQLITVLSCAHYCLDDSKEFKGIALTMSMMISCAQNIVIYVALALNSQQIINVIQLVQKIVDNRKHHHILIFYLCPRSNHNLFV